MDVFYVSLMCGTKFQMDETLDSISDETPTATENQQ